MSFANRKACRFREHVVKTISQILSIVFKFACAQDDIDILIVLEDFVNLHDA